MGSRSREIAIAQGHSMSSDERTELLADLAERGRYFATLTDIGLPAAEKHAEPVTLVSQRVDTMPRAGSDAAGPIAAQSVESLEALRADLGDCQRCGLAGSRRTIVFGQGNPHARLMFVGEAPGAEEDEQGLAFVGKAGQLLTKIIEAIGMRRDDVFIANVLKCRPPGNRNPEPDEIIQCQPFLERQIESIRPEVLVGLGKFGAHWLLKTAEPITRLRGRVGAYKGIKVMPTYHPAYLLRNPGAKKEVWEDMKVVRDLLAR
jgi:DNA polymerase